MRTTLEQLEAGLSPHAKHALETYAIAFWAGDPQLTVREIRRMIAGLYGQAVEDELARHLSDRVSAVLPSSFTPPATRPE